MNIGTAKYVNSGTLNECSQVCLEVYNKVWVKDKHIRGGFFWYMYYRG